MIGKTISHYRIIEEVGRGGMGVVYKAQDTKLDRPVALKILSSEQGSEDSRVQLLREARSTAAIHHPNICSIIDVLEFDGQEFLVMEFIEGQSLRTLIGAGPLDISKAINISLQIAEGLHAAHTKGIIHRDIKPENIHITGDDIVKIADFGLAKGIEQQVTSDAHTIAGTVAYMSPEQLQGQQVDCTTDIWSLGIILYEMVSGKRPFTGEYTEALMYEISHEKQRPVSGLRTDVPGSLEVIIDRCLEKIPAVRFSGAKMLIAELKLIEQAMTNPRGSEIKSIAVLPFTDISPDKDNQYFSEGLTEEIIANLSKVRMVKVISRISVMQYNRTGKTTKQIAADLGVQYILEGSVRKHANDLRITTQLIDTVNDTYQWSEKFRGTMDDIFDFQETVAAKITKALKVRLTPVEKKSLKRRSTGNTEAYQLYLKGRFFWNKRNEEALQTAIRYFEDAIQKDPQYALAWAGLADSNNLLSDYDGISRKERYLKAKAAVKKALELDGQLAEARTSLAFLEMLYEWNWANAEKEFKLAIYLKPNYATAHHWYSELLLYWGQKDEAIREITLAAELDPLSPAILKDKGVAHAYFRQYDEAIEHAKKALELDPNFASAHRLLSLGYQGKGMYSEAVAENQKWGEMTGNHVEALVAYAQIQAVSGKTADAIHTLESIPAEQLTGGILFRGMALVYAALRENDLAFEWLNKAYAIRSESLCSLKIDPKMDNLRTDPRFSILLKNIGLEK